ncbi:MAG TPA: transposase, partial [Phycisphaerae bacterium]|nr:transposase [Phycisphaerae bacterium]
MKFSIFDQPPACPPGPNPSSTIVDNPSDHRRKRHPLLRRTRLVPALALPEKITLIPQPLPFAKRFDAQATAGLPRQHPVLAYIVTSKFADYLPLYRLEGIFERNGLEISRATQSVWCVDVAELVR